MDPPSFTTAEPAAPLPPPPLPRRRRKPHWILWTLLIISLAGNLVTCTNFGDQWSSIGADEFPMVDHFLLWGNADAETQVAVITLEGVIVREAASTLFGEVVDPVTKILNEIRAVTVDPAIQAILLEIDSPGGGVTESDEIYNALMDFKAADPDRKIVVHIRDMAASGGYYVALAGDLLVAQPTSVVGSVGVMISAVNMNQLGQKVGIQDVTLTSSSNKALLNSLAPVNPEHMEILQQVVDQMYDRFRNLVLEHRPFDAAFADENRLLDGRIFAQPAALTFGLVDETGYMDHTRQRVLDLLGVEEAAFYGVEYGSSGWGSVFSVKSPEILEPLQPHSGFQYLWKP
ncbi:MAG: signal peptide peptidase SppA [Kiritimatiellia bacterium]